MNLVILAMTKQSFENIRAYARSIKVIMVNYNNKIRLE